MYLYGHIEEREREMEIKWGGKGKRGKPYIRLCARVGTYVLSITPTAHMDDVVRAVWRDLYRNPADINAGEIR